MSCVEEREQDCSCGKLGECREPDDSWNEGYDRKIDEVSFFMLNTSKYSGFQLSCIFLNNLKKPNRLRKALSIKFNSNNDYVYCHTQFSQQDTVSYIK